MPAARCCFPECEEQVSGAHVACVPHWSSLPPRVKAAVQFRICGWSDKPAAREFIQTWLRIEKKKGIAQ